MDVQELKRYIDLLIGQQIDRCDEVADGLEGIDEIPRTVWPPDDVIHGYEMFIKGYAIGSIETLLLDWVLASDELNRADYVNLDTTPLRTYAAEQVEERRDELRDALTPNRW
ncbi:hypothetical protein [Salinigranum halophilum]|jgi:hypothetical protein|uniref:hypothetical protein n=1 Tax=Salinigranum halophilum TaxID=2565931 RepID=UPI0010A7EBE2|nr:hypothetical protein [Salinigranum halophilum]